MMNDMNISDSQQHFMDELLGQNSEHGNMVSFMTTSVCARVIIIFYDAY